MKTFRHSVELPFTYIQDVAACFCLDKTKIGKRFPGGVEILFPDPYLIPHDRMLIRCHITSEVE